jgi:hypothetical protein
MPGANVACRDLTAELLAATADRSTLLRSAPVVPTLPDKAPEYATTVPPIHPA